MDEKTEVEVCSALVSAAQVMREAREALSPTDPRGHALLITEARLVDLAQRLRGNEMAEALFRRTTRMP